MSTPIQNHSESVMRILRVLRGDLLFLSREQVEVLSEGNKRSANKLLGRLVSARILKKRLRLDNYANFRSPVYHLGVEGCRAIGMSKDEIMNYMTKVRTYADRALQHLLEVNDVFIKFYLGSRVTEWLWHDDDKWFSVELGLYPDGYVQFEKDGKKYGAFIELDRETEGLQVLKKKFEKYAQFKRSGGFKKLFGDRMFRVLFITTTKEWIDRIEAENPGDHIWFTTKKDFMGKSLWERHWFAREDLYSLDFAALPEPPEPPRSIVPELDRGISAEEEERRWRDQLEEARNRGHRINNKLAWGSLYGFVGIWGLSLASLKPVVTLIILLVVLYVVIFSEA